MLEIWELIRTEKEMEDLNMKGVDQFFHCLAACRATKVDSEKERVLELMKLKELKDVIQHGTIGYGTGIDSAEELWADIMQDLLANHHGASCPANTSCEDNCQRFIDEMTNTPKSQEKMRERYPKTIFPVPENRLPRSEPID